MSTTLHDAAVSGATTTTTQPDPDGGQLDTLDLSPHLRPADLAARWRTSVGHLANLRSEGRGPRYVRLAGEVLYRLADVLDHEAAAVVEPDAA